MAEGHERAQDLGDEGGVRVLLGADLPEVHARPQEDPRGDELQGVVAADACAQRALDVVKGSQWRFLALVQWESAAGRRRFDASS